MAEPREGKGEVISVKHGAACVGGAAWAVEWGERTLEMWVEPGPEDQVLLAVTQALDSFNSVGQCFSSCKMFE